MKTHTSGYKTAIKTLGRRITTRVTYQSNGQTVELGKEDLNSAALHYEGDILKSVMRQLDIDSNVEIPKGTILNCQFGIKVGNSFEYMNLGNFIVYEIEQQEDKRSYLLTCYDKMLYSMTPYEDMGITYPITIRDYINTIATHLGLTFKNASSSFANWNKQIQQELYLDSEGNSMDYTFRDVLDEIAQATASTICIDEETDQLEIRYITSTLDTVDEEFLNEDNVNIGEKYGPINSIVLSRAAGTDNVYLRDETSVTQNGLCEIKIIDNQIMNFNDRSTYLIDILAKLNGLEYYLNDITSTGITYYNLCDKYNIQIGENLYSCVMFNDEIDIDQGLSEKIYTNLPEKSETDYTKADKTDRRITQTYIIVDKQNNVIESVVSDVGEQNSKISQINQTVDELNAKISDIADVTVTGESNEAYLVMEHINASEPIGIKIRPTGNNISYLYPHSSLYPSSNLFMPTRTVRFTNTTTNEIFDLTLPEDLLYYNGSIYDEFILDYENEIFQVKKRCEYNANGTVSALATEETHNYTYDHINLTDGDYTVEILGYTAAYIYVRLMAANIYTSQFATRVEMTSAINQTATEINIRVDEKLDEEEFTHAEIVAKINDDTSQIKIDADKVDIEANDVLNILAGNSINLTSKNMTINSDHFNVDTSGNLNCSNATISGNITATSGTFNGTVNATNGTFNGTVNATDGTFNGTVNATNGTFNGTINANSGTIGRYQITSEYLQTGTGNTQAGIGGNAALWAGSETSSSAPFHVNYDGSLYASNANITGTIHANSGSFKGTITASSGSIGGWTINSSGITGKYGNTTTTLTPRGIHVDTGTSTYWRNWTSI